MGQALCWVQGHSGGKMGPESALAKGSRGAWPGQAAALGAVSDTWMGGRVTRQGAPPRWRVWQVQRTHGKMDLEAGVAAMGS